MKKTTVLLAVTLMASQAAAQNWQYPENLSKPENVSLKLEFDPGSEVYIDDETAQEKIYNPSELDYPYITSDQPLGIVSYSPLVEIEYTDDSQDRMRVVQKDGSFLLPFTRSGHEAIESREEEVTQREFLDLLEPSFGFESREVPRIRVIYSFVHSVEGFPSQEEGRVHLAVRNRLSGDTRLLLERLG